MAFSTAQSQVAAAIKNLEECPEAVKQMFLASLPNAFGPSSNLHQYQKEVASMLRKTLEEACAAANDSREAAAEKIKEARTAMEALQADVASTEADEDSARACLEEKMALLEKAKASVAAEEALCENANIAKGQVEADRQQLETAKAEVESVMNGSFRMLLDGGWGDDEVRDDCIEAVCRYLQEGSGDVVLLAALPKALAILPDKRGTFDNITVEEASRTISEKISTLTAQLAAGEEKFEDATAEHLGAWAILDVARDHAKAATQARDEADSALQSVTVEKKVASSKVMDHDATLNNLLSQETIIETNVQQLETALTALSQLEAGEEVDKASTMEVEKEGKEDAMMLDKENNGNAMAVEHLPLPVAA